MKLLYIPLAVYVALLVFYVLYIAAINIYRDWGTLSGWVQLFAFAPVVIMVVLDMLMQFTLVTILFWDWPREGMVTQRLARYQSPATAPGWRKTIATAICTQALNPFDPQKHHC